MSRRLPASAPKAKGGRPNHCLRCGALACFGRGGGDDRPKEWFCQDHWLIEPEGQAMVARNMMSTAPDD